MLVILKVDGEERVFEERYESNNGPSIAGLDRFDDPRVRVLALCAEDLGGLQIGIDFDGNRVVFSLLDRENVPYLMEKGHIDDAYGILLKLVRSSGRIMSGALNF